MSEGELTRVGTFAVLNAGGPDVRAVSESGEDAVDLDNDIIHGGPGRDQPGEGGAVDLRFRGQDEVIGRLDL